MSYDDQMGGMIEGGFLGVIGALVVLVVLDYFHWMEPLRLFLESL